MDENNEFQNSPTSDEITELDSLLGDEPETPAETPQVDWEKQAKSAQKFLKELKDITGSNSVKEIKEKFAKPKPEAPKKEVDREEPTISVVDMLELKKQSLSDDEILDLHNQAKSLNVPIAKLLQNDIFKEGLERKREKAKVQQATPNPSQRVAPVFEGKKSFDELSPAERQANWQTAISKVKKGSGSNE